MERNIVGDWGKELSDAEYGQALAALGALEATGTEQHEATDDPQRVLEALRQEFQDGERTVVWRGAFNIDAETPEGWQKTIHANPRALAEGWLLLLKTAEHPRKRPRLAVAAGWRRRPDLFDFNALMDWLATRNTNCQALVLLPEDAQEVECRTLWHWPLRVGVPAGAPGGPLLDSLRAMRNGWIEHLAIPQPVGEARDSCDLLILPPGMAAYLAAQPRLYLQASFVVCLDAPVPWSAAVDTPHAQLRAKMGAAGIACVGEFFDPGSWYEELMRELSHDMPVSGAVWSVGLRLTNFPPLVVGALKALDRLRILTVADRIDQKFEMMLAPQLYEKEYAKAEAPKKMRRAAKNGALRTKILSRAFKAETVDGLPIAAVIAEKTTELEERRVLRYIQAQAWRKDSEGEPAAALAPDGPSLLAVHIGPAAAPQVEPFPDSQFDFSAGPVTLNVQVEVEGAAMVPLATNILRFPGVHWTAVANDVCRHLHTLMPPPEPEEAGQRVVGVASDSIQLPLAGESSKAVFGLWPHPGLEEVTGRIAIVHQNRIVQTARLKAPVGKQPKSGLGVSVVTEAVIHPRLDDLAERRKFDATLIAADDLGSRLRLTVNCDGVGQEIEVENLDGLVKKIYTAICEVTRRPEEEDTLPLNSGTMRLVLRSLASQGRLLYDALRAKLGEKLSEIGRFQVICFGNTFLPLEYIYDGPRLKLNAEVCPNSAEAVRRGDCGNCTHQGSTDFLCPLHFWGLTKVIERHVHDDQARDSGPGGKVERGQLSSPTREPFGPVKPVLFGASFRAFDFDAGASWRKKLVQALKLLGEAPPALAKTWDEWRAKISKLKPKVLVLLPHTDTVDLGVDVLGIEKKEFLAKDEIDIDLVGVPETVQLLLLLGCGAAQVTESFAPYPQLFHSAGADVIIAPLAPILGADAAPIAMRIAELLAGDLSQGREVAFGELLRGLRRELLAEGHPGVFGLVGFGDADWVFGG